MQNFNGKNYMNEIVLFGCGGHSKSVADVILYNNPLEILVFVDAGARDNEMIFGFDVQPNIQLKTGTRCIVCVGSNVTRKNKYVELGDANIITVVSKLAYIGKDVTIGRGTFVAHSCHLGPEVNLGENTIVNTGSVIEHEARIGSHSHIGPSATISGRSVIGDQVAIGAGACVIDNISICSNTIVGANSTVIHPISEPGTYAGNPARKVN
jgi:UDP-N-acetylbacillosamine N-acetyltransferase